MLKQYQSCLKTYILNFFKGEGMGSKRNWRKQKIPALKENNRRVLKILENIQRSQGFQTEERFMAALKNGNGNNPDWYKGVSKSTNEQDQKKIDCIVHTAFGNIFVQIKSSQAGANKFLSKMNKSHLRIVLLVIKRHYSEDTIREISFTAIQAEINFYKKPSC